MTNTDKRKFASLAMLIVFVVALLVFLFFVEPEEFVKKIGIQNGYILAFVVSFFGGFSAGGSISFYGLLVTLISGGMNPFYLGLTAGVSLAIGDLIMFYLGQEGRGLIKGKWDERIDRIKNAFEKRRWLKNATPLWAYLYMGFSPFPNDILLLSLAALKYPIKKLTPVIILGDITFTLLITFVIARGVVGTG